MPHLTGIILNWRRAPNVRTIVDAWQASPTVVDAIVWNNNPAVYFTHPWAKCINADSDLGLYTRFAAACLSQTEGVLIQDDDVVLPEATIATLASAWEADPEVVHGIFGRGPRPEDGTYAEKHRGDAEVPIVLTRALVASRRLAGRFFVHSPEFDDLQRDSRPAGNGEDILFNYIAMRYSGRPNRIHDVEVEELPAPHSIWQRDRSEHMEHRTRVMQAAERWLGTPAGER